MAPSESLLEPEDFVRYCDKSGDYRIHDDIIRIPGRGFASICIENGQLVVRQCYGDGKYWAEIFRAYAREKGIQEIRFFTTRNPKAFERRFGAKLMGYVMELPQEGSQ